MSIQTESYVSRTQFLENTVIEELKKSANYKALTGFFDKVCGVSLVGTIGSLFFLDKRITLLYGGLITPLTILASFYCYEKYRSNTIVTNILNSEIEKLKKQVETQNDKKSDVTQQTIHSDFQRQESTDQTQPFTESYVALTQFLENFVIEELDIEELKNYVKELKKSANYRALARFINIVHAVSFIGSFAGSFFDRRITLLYVGLNTALIILENSYFVEKYRSNTIVANILNSEAEKLKKQVETQNDKKSVDGKKVNEELKRN